MIEPNGIPISELNKVLSALDENVSRLSGLGQQFTDLGNNVHNNFQGLNGVYHAPEREVLVNSTQKIKKNLDEFGPSLPSMSRHLTNLASEVRGRVGTLKDIKEQAFEWHRKKNGNPDWKNDQDMIDCNNRMVGDVRPDHQGGVPATSASPPRTRSSGCTAGSPGTRRPAYAKVRRRRSRRKRASRRRRRGVPRRSGTSRWWQDVLEFPGNVVIGVAHGPR